MNKDLKNFNFPNAPKIKFGLALSIVVILGSNGYAFAQSQNVSILAKTDLPSYNSGDQVIFSGVIRGYDPSIHSADILYKVFSPQGNAVRLGQIAPSSDGTFSDSFVTGGSFWNKSGYYVITLYFDSQVGTAEFEFIAPIAQPVLEPQPKPAPQKTPAPQPIPEPEPEPEPEPIPELVSQPPSLPQPIPEPKNPLQEIAPIAASLGAVAAGGIVILLKSGMIAGAKTSVASASSAGQSSSINQASQNQSLEKPEVKEPDDALKHLLEIEIEIRGGLE